MADVGEAADDELERTHRMRDAAQRLPRPNPWLRARRVDTPAFGYCPVPV
jgi:hypothetical protein